MSIDEKSKINITLISALSVICFLIASSFGVGVNLANLEQKVENTEIKLTHHINTCREDSLQYDAFKMDISTQLGQIQADIKRLLKDNETRR